MAKTFYADVVQPDFGLPWRPVLPRSFWDDKTIEEVAAYVKLRQKVEQDAINNPVGQGWILPSWKTVMDNWKKYPIIVLLGGNRSSKSTLASRLTVWCAATIPESEVRC